MGNIVGFLFLTTLRYHKFVYEVEILDFQVPSQDGADEDNNEDHSYLAGRISELETRKQLYEEYLTELKESGNTQKLTTDPEARMMHSQKDGFHCCYNVQTAVDSVTHMIGHYSVTNHLNDMDMPSISVVADKGYDGTDEIEACYENTNISVEVCTEGQVGCFQRSQDQMTVACPMGFTLRRTKIKGEGMVYANRAACRQCTNRCTPSKSFKTVYFGPNADCVAVRMNRNIPPVNTPPPDFTVQGDKKDHSGAGA